MLTSEYENQEPQCLKPMTLLTFDLLYDGYFILWACKNTAFNLKSL